jgi:hypothetical protein
MDQEEDVVQATAVDVAAGEELSGLVFGVQGKFSSTKKVRDAVLVAQRVFGRCFIVLTTSEILITLPCQFIALL